MDSKKTIWQICDGKQGHENQSSGLIAAIKDKLELETVRIDVSENKATWISAALNRFKFASKLPKPDLIVAAGSQTHSTLLAAGRATSCPTIVMMAPPTLLTRHFSLCVIPEHDGREGPNIETTKGAVNLVRPSGSSEVGKGLILIGGPSPHYSWDPTALLKSIDQILKGSLSTNWKLTTSRRTPSDTTSQLSAIEEPSLQVFPVEQTDSNWLTNEMAQAAQVWVTEDSVSMVYEALSSGARVGLLPAPRKKQNSRVIRGLDSLIANGYVLPFDSNNFDLSDFSARAPLNEANRIADLVIERFL